jgi:hypothetical protein
MSGGKTNSSQSEVCFNRVNTGENHPTSVIPCVFAAALRGVDLVSTQLLGLRMVLLDPSELDRRTLLGNVR